MLGVDVESIRTRKTRNGLASHDRNRAECSGMQVWTVTRRWAGVRNTLSHIFLHMFLAHVLTPDLILKLDTNMIACNCFAFM
jgi:hypothetical protein